MKRLFRRRHVLVGAGWAILSAGGVAAATWLLEHWKRATPPASAVNEGPGTSEDSMIKETFALDFQWRTQEPFLFCVHHYDLYPRGEPHFGPASAPLAGRELGQDFAGRDGFRMYHGEVVPGFPVHPHRGFETVTIVRKGYVDHADSLGAAGRYGEGDVQWMTAGAGVQHSEMFPLLRPDRENTLELFQIWLNLPRRSKMVAPHFAMFWSEKIPRVTSDGAEVRVIAGRFGEQTAIAPPPDSWAADPEHAVEILLVRLEPGARLQLSAARGAVNRSLYVFGEAGLKVNGTPLPSRRGANLEAGEVSLEATDGATEALWLQAKPIGEPLVQHGPFVMNSRAEIMQAFEDYQRTQFGGWPWPRYDMIHGGGHQRFARYPDGRIEKPGDQG